MKKFDFKNVETIGACWAIHLILTFLLAICLAAYDGVEHTYPILYVYMLIGWVIPFFFWQTVQKIVSVPVSSKRQSINIYAAPIGFIVMGTFAFLFGLFESASWVDYIKTDSGTIWNTDPRFPKLLLENKFEVCSAGLFFVFLGYVTLRFTRQRNTKNQEQKSEE